MEGLFNQFQKLILNNKSYIEYNIIYEQLESILNSFYVMDWIDSNTIVKIKQNMNEINIKIKLKKDE